MCTVPHRRICHKMQQKNKPVVEHIYNIVLEAFTKLETVHFIDGYVHTLCCICIPLSGRTAL